MCLKRVCNVNPFVHVMEGTFAHNDWDPGLAAGMRRLVSWNNCRGHWYEHMTVKHELLLCVNCQPVADLRILHSAATHTLEELFFHADCLYNALNLASPPSKQTTIDLDLLPAEYQERLRTYFPALFGGSKPDNMDLDCNEPSSPPSVLPLASESLQPSTCTSGPCWYFPESVLFCL